MYCKKMRLQKLAVIFSGLLFISVDCQNSSQIDYYEKLIQEASIAAAGYIPPTDASKYKPVNSSATPIDYGSYDFIIVGGGTTGAVLAGRLSEVSRWKILVIEAGSFGTDVNDITAMANAAVLSDYNWAFRSVPQTTACQGMIDHICPYPRGRGMGGSTLLNALVYSRGHPTDYKRWSAQGNPGWSYAEVLPYFLRSENFTRRIPNAPVAPGFHSTRGPWSVEYSLPGNLQLDAFLQANMELGYNLTDPSGPRVTGYSQTQINTKNGRRQDTGTVFVKPVLNRPNLQVFTQSFATKVNINKITGIAKSVEFTRNGKRCTASAKREIILSAGAIGTPQLLMLSGIGPRAHLSSLGIPVIRNLEVGTTLRDHSQFQGLTFSSNYSSSDGSLRDLIAQFLNGEGPLSVAGLNLALGFYQTDNEKTPNYPDIEIVMVTANATSPAANRVFRWTDEVWNALYGDHDISNTFTLFVVLLHADSVGTIRLKSASPYDYPLIDSQFISDPRDKDIDTLYKGVQMALGLVDTEAFRKINAKLQVKPLSACSGFEYLSKDYWYCTLRQMTSNIFHPIGTCPMGPDPKRGAVVDARLRVYGTKRLRVADASVFPLTLTGHTAPICVMVGEKTSDIIKQDYNVI